MNGFGIAARETGQSRVPEPPLSITANMPVSRIVNDR
jgi:hypothetical protein